MSEIGLETKHLSAGDLLTFSQKVKLMKKQSKILINEV